MQLSELEEYSTLLSWIAANKVLLILYLLIVNKTFTSWLKVNVWTTLSLGQSNTFHLIEIVLFIKNFIFIISIKKDSYFIFIYFWSNHTLFE